MPTAPGTLFRGQRNDPRLQVDDVGWTDVGDG
jgi:hypothetical protein